MGLLACRQVDPSGRAQGPEEAPTVLLDGQGNARCERSEPECERQSVEESDTEVSRIVPGPAACDGHQGSDTFERVEDGEYRPVDQSPARGLARCDSAG